MTSILLPAYPRSLFGTRRLLGPLLHLSDPLPTPLVLAAHLVNLLTLSKTHTSFPPIPPPFFALRSTLLSANLFVTTRSNSP